jgi:hypothetical protein
LAAIFRLPRFAGHGLAGLGTGQAVRRDAWEDGFGEVVAQLGLGTPIPPVDGLTRREVQPNGAPEVTLSTNKRGNVFEVGDRLLIFVENRSAGDAFVELVGTSVGGHSVILTPESCRLRPGERLRQPADGPGILIEPKEGRERVTLFASDRPFPPGEVLRVAPGEALRARDVGDRFVHTFFRVRDRGGRAEVGETDHRLAKKVVEIETK